MFKKGFGDWTQYRKLPNSREVDLHFGQREEGLFRENMDQNYDLALRELTEAQQQGVQYVIFLHGSSTSRPGKTTTRSQVRKLMRSPAATPYIRRGECIQHESIFVAAIRPPPGA